ncbi:transmembrane protein 134 isoform X4 [Leopardus geoffroyi]|uniref:transmembrane protein 134 isoform X4 n=1 Tax=Leopardus geoffroyi TaxID=46844 RepID=UPI00090482AC|nr:transmembrane protein 134 isoform X4 [Leopardus geoffroyi]XP_058545815.1 transmembrane protein 134 isoform X2 [Neofelis nebulosa]
MSAARPQFSIDDAFELSLEDAGPGPEFSGVARFGPLHFERRARFEVADEDKQSRLRYQNLENDEDAAQASPEPDGGVSISSQWSFSTISNSTQRSYHACCSWTQHPLIQKNRRVVLASFLLLLLGLGHTTEQRKISLQTFPRPCQVPCSENTELALILIAVGLEVAPSPGVSSAIFFVPGFLLLVPGVYHVIFIYCAVKGHRGFQFFYLPYFEK